MGALSARSGTSKYIYEHVRASVVGASIYYVTYKEMLLARNAINARAQGFATTHTDNFRTMPSFTTHY